MAEILTAEKIRIITKRRGLTIGDVAEGTGQTRQNFSNKMKRGDFKESELKAIAKVLNCDLTITFTDRENNEEF